MRCDVTQFSYNGKTKSFVAEASDFGPLREAHLLDRLTPLGTPTGDKGIFLRSGKTGTTIRYFLSKTQVAGDEVQCWAFRPVSEDVVRVPAAGGTKIVIYND